MRCATRRRRFDAIDVGNDRRTDHASFVENTEQQSAGWTHSARRLRHAEPDSDTIGELTTELTELTLGRNDLAAEMGLTGCWLASSRERSRSHLAARSTTNLGPS